MGNNAIILWVASLGETSAMLRLASCLLCLRPPVCLSLLVTSQTGHPGPVLFPEHGHVITVWSVKDVRDIEGISEFYEVESAVFGLIWVDPLTIPGVCSLLLV